MENYQIKCEDFLELKNRLENIERLTALSAKKVLNMDEVALLTSLSKSYIYKLVHQRLIPHWKNDQNRINYFNKSEIEDWMLKHKVKTTDEIQEEADNYLSKNKK